MRIGRRGATRLFAVGLTGALTLGLLSPAVASAGVTRAAEERTDGYVNVCRHVRVLKAELTRAQAWLDDVAELAPAEWDVYINRARRALQYAKERVTALVRSGHCNISIARLCSYTDEARRLYTRVNNLLTAGINQSSGELRELLEQGQAHLQRVAAYVQRLAAAHCGS